MPMWTILLDQLPRGNTLAAADWQRRHRLLIWVLALHVPGLALFGVVLGRSVSAELYALVVPAVCVVLGRVLRRHRRGGPGLFSPRLVFCSPSPVGVAGGGLQGALPLFFIL